jgi:hypothetical protein
MNSADAEPRRFARRCGPARDALSFKATLALESITTSPLRHYAGSQRLAPRTTTVGSRPS